MRELPQNKSKLRQQLDFTGNSEVTIFTAPLVHKNLFIGRIALPLFGQATMYGHQACINYEQSIIQICFFTGDTDVCIQISNEKNYD